MWPVRSTLTLVADVDKGCKMGDDGAQHIAFIFKVNYTLVSLDVACKWHCRLLLPLLNPLANNIGDNGVAKFVDCLKKNTSLQSLNLSRINHQASGYRPNITSEQGG